MQFFVLEEAPGKFIWGLREANGSVIAKSIQTFTLKEEALKAAAAVAFALPDAEIEGE